MTLLTRSFREDRYPVLKASGPPGLIAWLKRLIKGTAGPPASHDGNNAANRS